MNMPREEVRKIVLETIMEVAQKAERLQTEISFNDYGQAAKQLLNDTSINK